MSMHQGYARSRILILRYPSSMFLLCDINTFNICFQLLSYWFVIHLVAETHFVRKAVEFLFVYARKVIMVKETVKVQNDSNNLFACTSFDFPFSILDIDEFANEIENNCDPNALYTNSECKGRHRCVVQSLFCNQIDFFN